MYKSFSISNFRCFDELNVSELKRVNLFAGANNVGKTALLEAIFIHCGAYNSRLVLLVDDIRGIRITNEIFNDKSPWRLIFSKFDTSKEIELKGESTENIIRTLKLKEYRSAEEIKKVQPDIQYVKSENGTALYSGEIIKVLRLESEEGQNKNYFNVIQTSNEILQPMIPSPPFLAALLPARMPVTLKQQAKYFSKLEADGKKPFLVEMLKSIEPLLSDLSLLYLGDEPVIHGKLEGSNHLMPLPIMGEGIGRLSEIIIHIGNAPGGVILIDEIENGIHHSKLKEIWKAINEASRQFNTQIFATTHSYECIEAANKAFGDARSDDFRSFRLENIEGKTEVISFEHEELDAAIENNMEIR